MNEGPIKYKIIGSSLSLPAHGRDGARATILSFLYSVPPSARKKFWPSNQAGEKEGGWGEGIFARLFCAVGAVGWEAFPPFGIKPNIKAKRLSNPFKRKKSELVGASGFEPGVTCSFTPLEIYLSESRESNSGYLLPKQAYCHYTTLRLYF